MPKKDPLPSAAEFRLEKLPPKLPDLHKPYSLPFHVETGAKTEPRDRSSGRVCRETRKDRPLPKDAYVMASSKIRDLPHAEAV